MQMSPIRMQNVNIRAGAPAVVCTVVASKVVGGFGWASADNIFVGAIPMSLEHSATWEIRFMVRWKKV